MRSASTPLGGEFSASSGVLAENSGHSEEWGSDVDLELSPCVLKNQPAVTVLDNELQSQLCLAIHYTHD